MQVVLTFPCFPELNLLAIYSSHIDIKGPGIVQALAIDELFLFYVARSPDRLKVVYSHDDSIFDKNLLLHIIFDLSIIDRRACLKFIDCN